MANIEIRGIDRLEAHLKNNTTMQDVKRVIRTNGAQLQQKMMRKADFTRGYQTGTTKRSITCLIKDSGMTAEVGPATEYSPYLEKGTRFMSAQPFVEPALNEQLPKFKSDMQKLVK